MLYINTFEQVVNNEYFNVLTLHVLQYTLCVYG